MFIVFMTIVPYGCAGEVDKAKDFIKAGMYPQAIELLKKRIEKTPTDAEAQYQIGICYIYINDFSNARDRFASAIKLKSDYGFKIGSEFRKAGNEAAKNNLSTAQGLYLQAVQYQSGLKNEIGTELITEGKNLFEKGQYKTAEDYFKSAIVINPDLKENVADYYYQAGTKPETAIDLKTICLDTAMKFSPKENIVKAYSEHYFDLSKNSKTTVEAISYLDIANRYGNKYSSELQAKKEQLKEEQLLATVKKYEAQLGSAKAIKLTDNDKWVEVCNINKGDRFQYISDSSFMIKVEKNSRELRSAPDKPNWIEYYSNDMIGNDSPVWLSKKNQDSYVYYWIIQNK